MRFKSDYDDLDIDKEVKDMQELNIILNSIVERSDGYFEKGLVLLEYSNKSSKWVVALGNNHGGDKEWPINNDITYVGIGEIE